MKPLVLLNPGPVNVSEAVRAAMAGPDWCHREQEALELVEEVRQRLRACLGLDERFSSVLLGGSGTAAVEAMIASFVPAGKRLLVVRNGVYGERIVAMARAHGIETLEVQAGWFERVDVAELERVLQRERGLGALALVHHETTTGLLNDVEAVGQLARAHGLRFLLDTVSGLGGDALELERWHVDAAACTANKCLQGMPGASFVLARRELFEPGAGAPRRTLYLDLPLYHERQEARDTPFTPPLQVLMALRQALRELAEETLAGRIQRYGQRARRLRQGLEALGLELLLPPALRSNTITTVRLPAGTSYEQLHDALKAAGFVIYAGQGELRRYAFRVANMGNISPEDVERCLEAFQQVLQGPRAPGARADSPAAPRPSQGEPVTPPLVFRKATLADLPRVVRLAQQLSLGEEQREDPSLPLHPVYLERFAELEADPNNLVVVAELEGAVVGTLQLTVIPLLAGRGSKVAQIETVVIDQPLRGRGLGEALVRWVMEEARRRGCDRVQLTSNKARTGAHRFYERLGFHVSHEGIKRSLAPEATS